MTPASPSCPQRSQLVPRRVALDREPFVEVALDVANTDVLDWRLSLNRAVDPIDEARDPPGCGSRPTRPSESAFGLDEGEVQVAVDLDYSDVAAVPRGDQSEAASV